MKHSDTPAFPIVLPSPLYWAVRICVVTIGICFSANASASILYTDKATFDSLYTNPTNVRDFSSPPSGFMDDPSWVQSEAWGTGFSIETRQPGGSMRQVHMWSHGKLYAAPVFPNARLFIQQYKPQIMGIFTSDGFIGWVPEDNCFLYLPIDTSISRIAYGYVDRVPEIPEIAAPIPEPSTFLLLLAGLPLLLKRKKHGT